MKFVIDAQLPPIMAHWLRMWGHEAEHLESLELLAADDATIFAHAKSSGAAIITKDEDFADHAKRSAESSPVVVWLRIGNCSNARLRAWIEPRLTGIVQMAGEGNRIIEVI